MVFHISFVWEFSFPFFGPSRTPILWDFWYVVKDIRMSHNPLKNLSLQFVEGLTPIWLDYRWRLLPWLANHEPQHKRGEQAPVTLIKQCKEKEGKITSEQSRPAWDSDARGRYETTCMNALWCKSMWNPGACIDSKHCWLQKQDFHSLLLTLLNCRWTDGNHPFCYTESLKDYEERQSRTKTFRWPSFNFYSD